MDTARAKTVLNGSSISDEFPNLQRISSEGTVFSNAVASSPWTLPSHASMFSGQYSSVHGTNAGSKYFQPDEKPLVEAVSDLGYQTSCFTNNPWISPSFGFDGFDEFNSCWKIFNRGESLADIAKTDGFIPQLRKLINKSASIDGPFTISNAIYMRYVRGLYDSGSRRTNRRFIKWVQNRENTMPFFAYINYMEPHLEYDPPQKFKIKTLSQAQIAKANDIKQDAWAYITGNSNIGEVEFGLLKKLYLAELKYLDYRIGKLYDVLESSGILKNTVVIITGDHGENISEHGLMDHQYNLYDSVIRVPLIISGGEKVLHKNICEDPVELRDIYPTVLDIANSYEGIECKVSSNNTSTNSLIRNQEISSGREYTISEYLSPMPSIPEVKRRYENIPNNIEQFDCAIRCIRTEEWKLIEYSDKEPELYNLKRDPEEVDPLVEGEADRIRKMSHIINEQLGKLNYTAHEDGRIEPQAKDRLEQLGYLQ